MSHELAVRKQYDLTEMKGIAEAFAKSGYFKDASDLPKAFVKILAGQELGIPPMQAMNGIHIVEGKPTLSATTIGALVKRSGRYDYRVEELTDEACILSFHQDGKEIGLSTFTIADARAANLVRPGSGWTKFPRNMLLSRALTNGARWYCPDVFGGAIYAPEELGEEVVEATPILDASPGGGPALDHDLEEELTASEPSQSLRDEATVEAPSAATDGSEDTRKRTPEPRCACGHAARSHREGPCKVQGCQCEEFRPSEPAGETADPSGPGVPQTPEPVSPVPPNGEVADAILALVAKFDADGRMDKRKFDVALTSRYGRSDVHALEPWEQQELREKLETFDANTSGQL